MKSLLKKSEMRFCITAMIWGILFTFLMPLWQVPDEDEHIKMIGQEIKNAKLAAILMEEAPLDQRSVRWHPEGRVGIGLLRDTMLKKPDYQRSDCLPKGLSVKAVRHLPAILGISLGILLGLPAYWVLIMGRLFSLAFYIVMCSVSLKLIPMEKNLLEIIMLLPMCIQEAASISYDAVLIPMCFFIISYALYLKFTVLEIGMMDAVVSVGSILCIALIKPPYIVLGGILMTVPIRKLQIKIGKLAITGDMIIKLKWVVRTAIFAVLSAGIYLGRNNTWIKLVEATIVHFPRTVWLFGRTCKVWGVHIFESMIGKFGYFDVRADTWFIAAVTAFVLVITMTKVKGADVAEASIELRDKVILYIVLGICFYLVTVSMISFTGGYDTHDWKETLYEITEIHGLQGRYYIPMLILFLLPFPKILEMKEKVYRKIIVGAYAFACIYTCIVIGFRYWSL